MLPEYLPHSRVFQVTLPSSSWSGDASRRSKCAVGSARRSWLPLWAVLLPVLFVFFAVHLYFAVAPFVNLESWSAGAAELMLHGRAREALLFLDNAIANPLGSVLGIVPFYFLFGVSEVSARLYSITCGALTLAACVGLRKCFGVSAVTAAVAAVAIAVNPYFWTWSGLAYSDVPFCLLLLLVLLTCCTAARGWAPAGHILPASLFAFAALTKYNAIVFLPVVPAVLIVEAFHRFESSRQRIRYVLASLSVYCLIGAVFLIPYLTWVVGTTGHLLNPKWVTGMSLDPRSSPLSLLVWRAAAHVVWLGIFAVPFAIFPVLSLLRRAGPRLGLVSFALLAGVATIGGHGYLEAQKLGTRFGEMQPGWIAWLFPSANGLEFVAALLFLLGAIVFADILLWTWESLRYRYICGMWILLTLSGHSFVRPTNRYMLFLLPPFAIYLSERILAEHPRPTFKIFKLGLLASGAVLSFALCIFNSAYFAAEGAAAAQVARFVNSHGLTDVEGGINNSVWCHSGYLVQPGRLSKTQDATNSYRVLTVRKSERVTGIVVDKPVTIAGVTFKRYVIVHNRQEQ